MSAHRGSVAALALLALLGVAACLAPGIASAQATRTWVSGVGDDANPCSRTAPCRTFAGAISKTAAGGVIDALDPGGFGGVTITKAITINGPDAVGGALVTGTNGIVVNAGPQDVVVLRNLSIHGLGTGLNGVRFLAGRALVLENLRIEAFARSGVMVEPLVATLSMRDVTMRTIGTAADVGDAGVRVAPQAGGSVDLQVDNLRVIDAEIGISISGPATGAIRNSSVQSSTSSGIVVDGAAAPVDVHVRSTTVTDSIANGVLVSGPNGIVRLAGTTISGNAQGLLVSAGGQLLSYGDNQVGGNLVDGAPTGVVATR